MKNTPITRKRPSTGKTTKPTTQSKIVEASVGLDQIVIDKEFEALLVHVEDPNGILLEEDLDQNGYRDPIVIWRENNTLLDGHRRFDHWKKNGSKQGCGPRIVSMSFPTREAAMHWVVTNQVARRNLNESQRAMLVLDFKPLYAAKAKQNRERGVRLDLDEGERGIDTMQTLAEIANVSRATMFKAQKVHEKCDPEIVRTVKEGKLSLDKASKVTELPCEQQCQALDPARTLPTRPKTHKKKQSPEVPANEDLLPATATDLVRTESHPSPPEPVTRTEPLGNPNKISKESFTILPETQPVAVVQSRHETSHEVPAQPSDVGKSCPPYEFAQFSTQQFDPSRDSDRTLEPGCREAVANAMFREVGQRFLCLLGGVERLMQMVHALAPRTLTPIDEDRERLCRSTESIGQDLMQLIHKWKSRG